jgi:hypothetical protein
VTSGPIPSPAMTAISKFCAIASFRFESMKKPTGDEPVGFEKLD